MVDRWLCLRNECSATMSSPVVRNQHCKSGKNAVPVYFPAVTMPCQDLYNEIWKSFSLLVPHWPLSTHGGLEEMGPTSFYGKQMLHRLRGIQRFTKSILPSFRLSSDISQLPMHYWSLPLGWTVAAVVQISLPDQLSALARTWHQKRKRQLENALSSSSWLRSSAGLWHLWCQLGSNQLENFMEFLGVEMLKIRECCHALLCGQHLTFSEPGRWGCCKRTWGLLWLGSQTLRFLGSDLFVEF